MRQKFNWTGQLSLKYGITVSQVFIREPDSLHGDTPFLSNVREEAVPTLKVNIRPVFQNLILPTLLVV